MDSFRFSNILVVVLHFCGIFIVSSEYTPEPGQKLIFEENFDSLNTSVWTHFLSARRDGPKQFQYFSTSKQNSFVDNNGYLHIVPTFTADRYGQAFLVNGTLNLTSEGCNFITRKQNNTHCQSKKTNEGDIINPIQSARLQTSKSFNFTYGVVEIRAKLARGDWLHSVISLLPRSYRYGDWPRSGTINIAQLRGNNDYNCSGVQKGNKYSTSSLHWGPSTKDYASKTTWSILSNKSLSDNFHLYAMKWLPTGFTFYVDDKIIGNISAPAGGFYKLSGSKNNNPWKNATELAPFDKKFFISLGLAAGGNFFSDKCVNKNSSGAVVPMPWNRKSAVQMKTFWEAKSKWYPTWTKNSTDSHMIVDYVRVWSV